jgi:ubiquinone/menaquinone biosynthesis C-methylase UbiE
MPYLKIDEGMTPQERRQQAYREKYKRLDPAWDDSIISLAKLFRERAGSGLTVLDAGCGRGNYVLESNQALVKKIVGVDASKEATTGNALAEEIVVADLEKLPFPDSSFDAVTSLWVLEHLRRPDRFFAEAERVLKPGGKLFLVTPHSNSYVLLIKKLVGRRLTRFVLEWLFGRSEADTFRAYYAANTAKDLRRLAKEAGLKELALIENPDPSYLAINGPFFRLALLVQRVARRLGSKIAVMHLIGVFEKTR